eukprot:Clim_evm5s16 gene=Clim_evmTU5s16
MVPWTDARVLELRAELDALVEEVKELLFEDFPEKYTTVTGVEVQDKLMPDVEEIPFRKARKVFKDITPHEAINAIWGAGEDHQAILEKDIAQFHKFACLDLDPRPMGLSHMFIKTPPFLAHRDQVTVGTTVKVDDDFYLMVYKSAPNDLAGECGYPEGWEETVRTVTHRGGWAAKRKDDGSCEIWRFGQADPGGNIPKQIAKFLQTKWIHHVEHFPKFLEAVKKDYGGRYPTDDELWEFAKAHLGKVEEARKRKPDKELMLERKEEKKQEKLEKKQEKLEKKQQKKQEKLDKKLEKQQEKLHGKKQEMNHEKGPEKKQETQPPKEQEAEPAKEPQTAQPQLTSH